MSPYSLGGDMPAWLIAVNLISRAVAVGLLLAILTDLVQARRRNGPILRALAWVFGTLTGLFTITWIASLEEALDFVPGVNLRLWLSDWIFLVYPPVIGSLWWFRRSFRKQQ